MNDAPKYWRDKHLTEGRAAGKICKDCTKEIEQYRKDFAKKNNYNAPIRCLGCSKEWTAFLANHY